MIEPSDDPALDAPVEERVLAEIGVSEQEERGYRLLLARGSLTVCDVGERLQLGHAQSVRLLTALQSKGLATCVPGSAVCFRPTAPAAAIEALILRKQAALERTRGAIALLQLESEQAARVSNEAAGCVVAVVNGRDAQLQGYQQLLRTAQREVRSLLPAPCLLLGSLAAERANARARGVRYLSVLDAQGLDCGTSEQWRGELQALDVCRTVRCVPLRLTIADRNLALLPLDAHDPHGASLLVKPSPLLDGLNAMFDMIWNSATPEMAEFGASPRSLGHELDALIPLLAAGLNDKAIAYRLRISVRTLLRRVARLSSELDARSRFQAGWVAARRMYASGAQLENPSLDCVRREVLPLEPGRVTAARLTREAQPPT